MDSFSATHFLCYHNVGLPTCLLALNCVKTHRQFSSILMPHYKVFLLKVISLLTPTIQFSHSSVLFFWISTCNLCASS
jgi:hypothetical protein